MLAMHRILTMYLPIFMMLKFKFDGGKGRKKSASGQIFEQ
jgi:hypothetical protein